MTSVIVDASRPAQLLENLTAVEGPAFTDDEHARIDDEHARIDAILADGEV